MYPQHMKGIILLTAMSICNCCIAVSQQYATQGYFFNSDEDQSLEQQARNLQTTYSPSTLTLSTFNGNYGNFGSMFYVKALSDITVTSIGIYTNQQVSNGLPVQVYSRPGKYIGFEGSSAGWTLIYDNNPAMFGRLNTTDLVGLNQNIPPGSFHSFFVWTPNIRLQYNPGTTEEALYSSNKYIEFYEGAGIGGLFDSSTLVAPRVLRGEMSFDVKFTAEPSSAPSFSPSMNPRCVIVNIDLVVV